MKFNKVILANAATIWIGVVYLFCGLAIALFPEISKLVTQSWFHGIDMGQIWSARPFPGNFLLGFVSAIGSTWVATYFFAYLYNYLLDRK